MRIVAIVDYWRAQRKSSLGWAHPDDEYLLSKLPHTFNLDYPVSPYVGDIIQAPVIVLNANAGFDPVRTPAEFTDEAVIQNYVLQVREPAEVAWSHVADYYLSRNYGPMIRPRKIVAINACPYRSIKISDESDNKKVIASLPSTKFHRRWFREAIVPLVQRGERMVLAHRWGYWKLSQEERAIPGVFLDLKCRAFPDVDSSLLLKARLFAEGK